MKRWIEAVLLAGSVTMAASAQSIIDKPPDQGPFWNPVGNSGTYVYADCFVAPATAKVVTDLGTWLEPLGGAVPHSIVRMEVWGDAGGPDASTVIAATAPFSTNTPGLNLYVMPVVSGGGPLTPGVTYWFVITAVGMGDPSLAAYRVGAHTQNSVYPDNCTFWFSNDPAGIAFDGQNLTPEMAFQVYLSLPPGEVNFFLDPAQFFGALDASNKVSKAAWDFKPNSVEPGGFRLYNDVPPLDINTHGAVPDDAWTDLDGTDLWPPEVDNVQFAVSTTPGGPLTPRGDPGALAFATAGSAPDVDNNVLVANFFVDSFNIISGPPADDNHTAIGLDLVAVAFQPPGTVPVVWTINVYDKTDGLVGTFSVDGLNGVKQFVGILRKDRETIGRVEVFEASGQGISEGISFIELFQNLENPCPWDLDGDGNVGIVDLLDLLARWGPNPGHPADFNGDGVVGITDLLKLLANWGPCPGGNQNACEPPGICGTHQQCGQGQPFNCFCFEVDFNAAGPGICIQDFLCADVQPCPPGGCPAGFVCVTNSCCGPAFCVPVIKCQDGAAPIPPGKGGPTGAGNFIEATVVPIDEGSLTKPKP